ncbi:hypothetical protein [Halorientalis pallida]|uniref:Uncharacterized protein n=1 Tax=Halorientalis pallida TaxID=2479928 RepID=A0A498KW69_9EURY|nr:hypothetical protein [Halorientalis pallida]RXK46723.1 hypothetical protein EAF64_18800 [Halorientalis pallida]
MDGNHDDTTDDWSRSGHDGRGDEADRVGGLWETIDESGVASRLVLDADTPGAVAAMFPDAATQQPDREIDVEWLAGDAANTVAVRARRTDEYARLLDVARKRRSRIRPIPETTTAARVTDGERVRTVVTFDVDTLQAETAHLTVSRHRNRDRRPTATLEYTTRNNRDRPEAATVYRTEGQDLDLTALDVARALTTDRDTDGGAGPSTVSCDCCRVAVGLVRRVGLTAPLTFTSSLLGPSVIGRFDTPTFAALVSRLDDPDEPSSARAVCERPEIGLCP